MKTVLALTAATLALTACSQRSETVVEPTATTSAAGTTPSPVANQPATGSMAGTYEATRPDGTRMTLTVKPDGSFTEVANGKELAGTWRMDGAKSCFDPAGDAPDVCYTNSAVAADGSFTSTAPDGTSMTIRKIAAAPAM